MQTQLLKKTRTQDRKEGYYRQSLVMELECIQKTCEENETILATSQDDFWQQKNTGSYYTPTDACDFFWEQFFQLRGIVEPKQVNHLLVSTEFVEPAIGAGIFLFSLIKKCLLAGCDINLLQQLKLIAYDINPKAITFVKSQLGKLEKKGLALGQCNFYLGDYLKSSIQTSNKNYKVFMGNPPFVKNQSGAKWKNCFADFFEKSYTCNEVDSAVAFIVPLSFNFSRDYASLRHEIFKDKNSVFSINFDNIPDCLFKSGKINSPNTNRANSQRCSMIFAFKDKKNKIFSTPLIRWSTAERKTILSGNVKYFDCSSLLLSGQIPRPASIDWVRYVGNASNNKFSSLLSNEGKLLLNVASVARNYISFRNRNDPNSHRLSFASYDDFLVGLTILASDVFYQNWLSLGDGFHLTKADVYNLPVSSELLEWAFKNKHIANKVWRQRAKYKKVKSNAGIITHSYDFTGVFKYWS